MTEKKTEKKKISFEDALARLEQIVAQIEQGEVSLEESIERYAEGIKLIKQCRSILDSAEKKIRILARADDGSLAAGGELEGPRANSASTSKGGAD